VFTVCATCNILRQLLIDRGMNPALAMSIGMEVGERVEEVAPIVATKAKKKVSAYNRKYKAAFKKVAPRYKLKNGKWKAGGFKRAVKEAHKMAGGKRK
jgi:2-phosphoglycerate kinase